MENTRSLARDFSSSRRAPPKARSNWLRSRACLRPSVFHMSVCMAEPWSKGLMPSRTHSGFWWTIRSSPRSATSVVAEGVHLLELPRRVHMEQRERGQRRVEGLHGQVQHDGAVLAHRVEHHRMLRLGGRLAHDVDALGLQALEVGQPPLRWCGGGRHHPFTMVEITSIASTRMLAALSLADSPTSIFTSAFFQVAAVSSTCIPVPSALGLRSRHHSTLANLPPVPIPPTAKTVAYSASRNVASSATRRHGPRSPAHAPLAPRRTASTPCRSVAISTRASQASLMAKLAEGRFASPVSLASQMRRSQRPRPR